jgi:hypothetical protein
MKAKRLIQEMLETSNNTFDEQVQQEYEESKQVCPICNGMIEGKECSCGYSENDIFSCPYLKEKEGKRICGIDKKIECDKYGLDYEGCKLYHSHWD